MAQAQQQLSNKDGALFRQVVRHFENKQYKKGAFYDGGLVTTLTFLLRAQVGGTDPAKNS